MADSRLQQLGKAYGGTFGGNGVNPLQSVSTIRRGVYFDPSSNQHFTMVNGMPKLVSPAQSSNGFFQKLGSIGTQAFHIGESAFKAGANFVIHTPSNIYHGTEPFLRPVAEVLTNAPGREIHNINSQQKLLEDNIKQYTEAYKSGKMSKKAYTAALLDASKGFQDLSSQAQEVQTYAEKEGNPRHVMLGAAETAALILSAGRYKPLEATGAKAVGGGFVMLNSNAARTGLEEVLVDAGQKLQNAMATIPSVRDLISRNLGAFTTQSAKQLAGETTSQFITRNAKDLAIGMLIKRPIVYQTTIGQADAVYNDIIKGHYEQSVKDAAWIGLLAIGGGPLGWAGRNSKALAGKIRDLASGKNSFIDEISKRIGDGSPAQISAYLDELKAAKGSIAPEATYYHGGTPINKESIRSSDLGYSVSSDKNVSKWFTNTKKGGSISEHTISPSAKILSAKDIPQELVDNFKRLDANKSLLENIQNGPAMTKDAERKIVAYARSKGYDAIDMRGEPFVLKGDGVLDNEAELRILNPDIITEKSAQSTQVAKQLDFRQAEKTLRIAQEVNLRASDDDAIRAAGAVISHYEQHAIDTQYLTPKQLVEDLNKWAKADEIARALSPKDMPTEYVAVRWDTTAKNALAMRMLQAGDDLQARADALYEIASQPGVGWTSNNILMSKIVNVIREPKPAEEIAREIKAIQTASTLVKDVPEAVAKRLAKLGYTVAEPFGGRKTPKIDFKDTRKLVTAISHGDSELFDETIAPHPVLDAIAAPLKKFGISPESNTRVAYDKLSDSLVTNLDQLHATQSFGMTGEDSSKGAKFVLSRLQTYVDKQAPNPYLNTLVAGRSQQSALQDIRQMNFKEIMEALPGTDKTTAKALQKAILKSYTDVSLEFRGLGIKAFDYAYRFPGAKAYFRIQSALRYTYNPFFRTQEVIETKMLSHMKANNLVWMKNRQTLDEGSKLLDDSKIFTTGYTGESTQDLTVGRIHANLLKSQKRDLAGLSMDLAEKRGLSLEQYIADYPDELADALRVIVQYPTKGVLNSPLARTLNIAFFPMRYNLKVAGLVAKEVSKLPPTYQTAFIHSTMNMSAWFKSPEGIQWQSDNADVLQLFTYFTIENNIQSVLHLLRGHVDSVSELGLLGGLPFGFISQILDAEGIVHMNTPYVNPKTGEVLPDWIPQTSKAKAAVALEGMLNTMFTYPGRIIGLPGKGQMIRNLVDDFLKTGGDEYLKQIRSDDLTPLQQKWIQVLSDSKVSQDTIDQLFVSPAESEYQGYTLPPSSLPKPLTVLTKEQVAAMKAAQRGTSTRGKKHALPIPAEGGSLQL